MTQTAETATVAVAEDERELADLYEVWLADHYDVRVAYGGEPALDVIDDDVDVVLLDRRMPDLHGDDVLDRLRERGFDGWVVMVTAVTPETDILELGFDDYLQKPLTKDDLVETIDRLLGRDRYATDLREFARLVAKRATLAAEHPTEELQQDEAYRELEARLDALEAELEASVADFEQADFEDAFRSL